MVNHRAKAKQIETWVPPTLDEVCGNYKLVEYLKACLGTVRPEHEPHALVQGDPGTGKTSTFLCYFRLRLNDPNAGYEDQAALFATAANKKYSLFRIDGGSRGREADEWFNRQMYDALYAGTEHSLVFVDEAGQMFANGKEEALKPMFDNPGVTVYATAQDFRHMRRRGDSPEDDDRRLRAFLGRFRKRFYTELPTHEDLTGFIRRRLTEFGIRCDSDKTVDLLAEKSKGIVRYVMGCLVDVVSSPDMNGVLTYNRVLRYNFDPLDD